MSKKFLSNQGLAYLIEQFYNKFYKKISNEFLKKNEVLTESVQTVSNKHFIAGQDGNESWSGFYSKRKANNKQIEATYGVGVAGNEGYAQINWEDRTNNLTTRLLLNYNSFIPSYDNRVDLGTDSVRFKNGYFRNSVFMGNDSTLNADSSNAYAQLNFKNNNNTVRYGYIGKSTTASNDLHLRAEQGHLYLTSSGEKNTHIGNIDNHFYTHFGSGIWRFAPNVGSNGMAILGTDTARFKAIFLTNNPNVASDRNTKENIVYLNDKEAIARDSSLITNDDMYKFVKDDLKLTKYNYINKRTDIKEEKEEVIGFIAQDVAENEKVANVLLKQGESGLLSYNTGTYTNILAGALQKALGKIEELENRINELEK